MDIETVVKEYLAGRSARYLADKYNCDISLIEQFIRDYQPKRATLKSLGFPVGKSSSVTKIN